MASGASVVLFASDILYFSHLTKEHSLEQKKFELANFLFICYLVFGGMCFALLEERWNFTTASEFCLMTLLTIGYGNVVPITFWGRFFMIIYSIVGLCLVGFFLISVEEVILQDSDSSNIV
ncbi:hypothetical protein HDU91_007037, partial [Kappamyces sp. JEL0680]